MLSPEQRRLWTVGYQGRSPEEFVRALTGAGVELIVDARWRAASHRPWFGRRALERLLARAGIGYAHAPLLGVPAELRREYLGRGDVDGFFHHYRESILPAARDEVERSPRWPWAPARRFSASSAMQHDATGPSSPTRWRRPWEGRRWSTSETSRRPRLLADDAAGGGTGWTAAARAAAVFVSMAGLRPGPKLDGAKGVLRMVRMAELVRRATGVWSDVWSTVEKPTLHAMGGFLVGLAFSSALMTQEALRRLVLAFVPSALSGHLAREVAMAVLLQWEIAVIVAVLAITDLRRRFPADGRDLGRWAAFAAGIAAGCLAVAASVW